MTNEKFVCVEHIDGVEVNTYYVGNGILEHRFYGDDGKVYKVERTTCGITKADMDKAVEDGTLYTRQIDGVNIIPNPQKDCYTLEKDGFTNRVHISEQTDDTEQALKELVRKFLNRIEGRVPIPTENLHKYLTWGALRDMLKDCPDDALVVDCHHSLVGTIAVGYLTEKVEDKERRLFFKNVDFAGGLVNSECLSEPAYEPDLQDRVEDTKNAVKEFIKYHKKDECIGIRLA